MCPTYELGINALYIETHSGSDKNNKCSKSLFFLLSECRANFNEGSIAIVADVRTLS